MATGESAVWAETDLNSEITYLLMISVHSYLRKQEGSKLNRHPLLPTSHYLIYHPKIYRGCHQDARRAARTSEVATVLAGPGGEILTFRFPQTETPFHYSGVST